MSSPADDMTLTEAEQRLVEHELLMLSDADLVQWAEGALGATTTEVDPDLIDLASLSIGQADLCDAAGTLLRAVVRRANPEFSASGPAAEAHARRAFQRLCARLVREEVSPYAFCRVIHPIEHRFDFPAWLEDFYSACDWCEPESTHGDFAHLLEYAAQYLARS